MNWKNLEGKKWRTCKRLPVLYHLKLCFLSLRALIRLSIYFFLVGLFFIFFPSILVYGVVSGKVPHSSACSAWFASGKTAFGSLTK